MEVRLGVAYGGVTGCGLWRCDCVYCREIVSIIDRDGDGLVDKNEVIAYLVHIDEHNSNQQVTRVMEKADKNKDGQISLEEFWKYSKGQRSMWAGVQGSV